MPLKIVTGGTVDAADGTLVSSGNHFAFTALDGVITLHLRCDDDTYSADQTITVPSDGDVELSLDGGSTWKTSADNPIPVATGVGLSGLDVGDLNFAVKLRQHASTASTSGQITSDGTFTACTALSDVTSFAVAAGASQIVVSWAAVTNRTRYQVDRATDSGFTTGVTLGVYTGTGLTFTDTGLASGTTYYYRIKAVGTYRYKDSANFATANVATFTAAFTSASVTASSYPLGIVEGPDGNLWVTLANADKIARISPSLGTVDEFACATGITGPNGICVFGGNIWYAGTGGIVKISTFSGTPTQTKYTPVAFGYGIVGGPDGNLWVTAADRNFHKINPSTGALTTSYLAVSGSDLRWIASDGTDLYATNRKDATGAVSRCTTSGTITTTALPDASAGPFGITYNPTDGLLYVVGQDAAKVYKVTTGATQTFTGYLIAAGARPGYCCVGQGGRIYSAGYDSSFKNIYSMAAGGGSFTNHSATWAGSGIGQLCGHSNGATYVCGYAGSANVGRLVT